MSSASVASNAASIDWNVVSGAFAVFIGTLVMTVLGWRKGQREVKKRIEDAGPVGAAILQDNLSVREATLATRDLRDQVFLLTHAVDKEVACREESNRITHDLLTEMRLIRASIDGFGKSS